MFLFFILPLGSWFLAALRKRQVSYIFFFCFFFVHSPLLISSTFYLGIRFFAVFYGRAMVRIILFASFILHSLLISFFSPLGFQFLLLFAKRYVFRKVFCCFFRFFHILLLISSFFLQVFCSLRARKFRNAE